MHWRPETGNGQPKQNDLKEQNFSDIIDLLCKLISLPSFSKAEDKTADAIATLLHERGVMANRKGNNVWALNKFFDPAKRTILLNSHHDTVKPNSGYTRGPFSPEITDGKLFGLGSNDAGGPLVSLIVAFLHFYGQENLKYNLVLAATAEEEISGAGGIESIWSSLPDISFAIVGEPTKCQMAIAENNVAKIRHLIAHFLPESKIVEVEKPEKIEAGSPEEKFFTKTPNLGLAEK